MDLSKFKLGPRLTEAFKANNGPEVRLHTEMFQELAPGLHAANPGSLRTAAELDNGMWLVHSKAHPNEHTPTPWDDLTYEIRAKLGLLRMSEDGTILEGIGARVDATTFALCPEDSHGA